MNLQQVKRLQHFDPNTLAVLDILVATFEQDDGTPYTLSRPVPDGWDGWTRAQKVDWAKTEIAAWLETNTVHSGEAVVYPDLAARGTAKTGIRELPGWATWTAAEADAYIAANVTDLASAKVVLRRMAQMLCYLRDIVVER